MSKILVENFGGKFQRKTLPENFGGKPSAENFGGKLLRKTLVENFCRKLWWKTSAESFGASQI
jgi:hypothetical protein